MFTKLVWAAAALSLMGGCDLAKKAEEAAEEAKQKSEEAAKPDEGDKCDTKGNVVCKKDDLMLECNGKKWESVPCRGEKGCTGSVVINCDNTISKEGDNCGDEENYSCTMDKKSQTKCVDGKWKVVAPCRGPKACETKFPFSKCDQSIVKADDACEKDGNAACSEDAKAIMECKGGKYTEAQKCATGKCVSEGVFVSCK